MATLSERNRWLRIAEDVCGNPTATGFEHLPAACVRSFAGARSGLSLEEDRYGNLLVKYPGRSRSKAAPIVLMAHLDHPGFVVERVRAPRRSPRGAGARASGTRVDLSFRGGVIRSHAKPGSRVHFFRAGEPSPIGKGVLESVSARGARRPTGLGSAVARVVSGAADPDGFAMWAFPGFALRGGKIVSRCLDDLLGVAAALATLDEVVRRAPRGARIWGLFTRAEEIGFFGALAAIEAGVIPKNARVLSLETSRALPHAPQGNGVVVRVGDGSSLFEPRLMAVLHQVAAELAAERKDFRFQRRLMDGGWCEATAFCAAGYRAGGITVPLGNYHNMKGLDGGAKGMGPESVAVSDYVAEVELLVRLAERSGELEKLEGRTAAWLAPSTARAIAMLEAEPLTGDNVQSASSRPAGRSRARKRAPRGRS